MSNWAHENGIEASPQSEAPAYMMYLPYSLVSYLFVLQSLVAIPFYAFSKRLSRLNREGQTLKPTNMIGQSEKEIIFTFMKFERKCQRECNRYIDVMGIAAL